MQQSCLLPAPHLFGVQEDWRLGAGPNCKGSACRCAQVGWEGGREAQSDQSSPEDLRAPGRCQLKKTFLQNKPHRLPESSAKTRGRSGLSGIHEAPHRPRRVRERAAAPRHPPSRGLGSAWSTRLHSVVNKSMVAASTLVCLLAIRTLRRRRLRNT